MKTLNISSTLCLTALLMLSSCHKNELEDYTFFYYVEYHHYSNETVAGYILQQYDNFNVFLAIGEELLMDGDPGYYTSDYDYHQTAFLEGIQSEVEFVFYGLSGNAYSNNIYLSDIDSIAVPDLPDEIDYSEDLIITWNGLPVANGERVELEIVGETFEKYFDVKEIAGANSFTVPDYILLGYLHEDITIKLTRIKSLPLTNPKTSGEVRMEYGSFKETVAVE